jgi:hypothetical protein
MSPACDSGGCPDAARFSLRGAFNPPLSLKDGGFVFFWRDSGAKKQRCLDKSFANML